MVISIAQEESVGSRDGGILVWLWVLGTHMIDLFHFWDASRGYVGVHSLWNGMFYLSTPKIEFENRLVYFGFNKIHLQEVIFNSGEDYSRHHNLEF